MTTGLPAITLQNVGVTYRSGLPLFGQRTVHQALRDVSFEICHSESIGIIGRNGAGKSTLLRLLNGIIQPDYGTLTNHNAQTTLLSLTVGYDQNVSGRNNAILQGMLLGLKEAEIRSHLDEIIEFSELGTFIDEPIKNYSTGMKQRLGFAVAIHVKTDVLLIDEILAVGDAHFRKKSEKVMRDKITSGDTIVLVSHQASTVRELCDKAVWIDKGVVAAYGDAETVVAAYEKAMR
jgi:lipopolysaccharide transport system ATP-binding protein